MENKVSFKSAQVNIYLAVIYSANQKSKRQTFLPKKQKKRFLSTAGEIGERDLKFGSSNNRAFKI